MLRTLLNFWLYPIFGMMFAAGAGVLDGAAGGGDAGGDTGGSSTDGDSSATGGDSTGSDVSITDGDDGTAGDSSSDEDRIADGNTDPNALVDSGDGRKIPQKYQELFKTDKALREMYFSQNALKKTFPGGVKEAVALAKSVEAFGGVEAVEQLQSEIANHQADAELFSNADPKWIESGFQENPEASLKLFAQTLDYVADNHSEHYNHLMAKVIKNDLDSSLPIGDIHALLAGMKDNPQAQELAKKLASYYNTRNKLAKDIPQKQIDPQQKKLDAKAAELSKKEETIRNKSINSEAAPYMATKIDGTLAKAAKDAGVDLVKLKTSPRYGRFLKDVRSAIHADVLGDTKWLDRYSAALASNDTAKCVRMLNARHDQAINGVGDKAGVVAPVFHEWFGAPKAGTRKVGDQSGNQTRNQNGNRGGSGGGTGTGKESPLIVNALPPAKDINYSDPKTDRWAGIYRLKTGKLIQVRRA